MSGLGGALQVGKSSLLTSQKAIEVTGNNIGNVNTPGYSRQLPRFGDFPTLNFGGVNIGRGVRVENILREHDSFVSRQIEQKSGALGEESARTAPLAQLEQIFSIGESGLAAQIDQFFDAWQQLSNDPSDLVARDQVLLQGQSLSASFQALDTDLERVRQGVNDTLESRLEQINVRLTEVAALNRRISEIEFTGRSANGDRDRRDMLLEELSADLGIGQLELDNGMVSLFLPGGLPLVQGGEALQLSGSWSGGDYALQLEAGPTTQYSLGQEHLGGALRGLTALRDDLLPSLRDDLDTLAFSLANAVNAQHQAGVGLDGVGGRDFFTPPAALSGAAGNLGVALSDARQLAAGLSAAPGDNGNALSLASLGQTQLVNGSDTPVDFYARIAGRVGTEVNQNRLAQTGHEDTLAQLKNLRDAKVGVSLEEEMVQLIQYQQSFEASAKFLATVDELMDSLLALKR